VVDVEDMHGSGVIIDAVDDAVGSAPGAVAAGEWSEQRLSDSMRVDRERVVTELEYRCRNSFRQAPGDRPPSGRLESQIEPG
jgi:hypothetical protein